MKNWKKLVAGGVIFAGGMLVGSKLTDLAYLMGGAQGINQSFDAWFNGEHGPEREELMRDFNATDGPFEAINRGYDGDGDPIFALKMREAKNVK